MEIEVQNYNLKQDEKAFGKFSYYSHDYYIYALAISETELIASGDGNGEIMVYSCYGEEGLLQFGTPIKSHENKITYL